MGSKDAMVLAKKYGFKFSHYGKGSHQIWFHPKTGKTLLVPTSKKGHHGWKAFCSDVKRLSS